MVGWKDEQNGKDTLDCRVGGSEIIMLVLKAQKGMKTEVVKEFRSRWGGWLI